MFDNHKLAYKLRHVDISNGKHQIHKNPTRISVTLEKRDTFFPLDKMGRHGTRPEPNTAGSDTNRT